MIKYTLGCNHGHEFESWFENAEAFDKLAANGLLSCVECNSTNIQKTLMAPRVRTDRKKALIPAAEQKTPAAEHAMMPPPPAGPSLPGDPKLAAAITAVKEHIEKNSKYVGKSFSQVARDMHFGDAKQEAIHGEASPDEAKSLIEDGISVVPLPFTPKQKLN